MNNDNRDHAVFANSLEMSLTRRLEADSALLIIILHRRLNRVFVLLPRRFSVEYITIHYEHYILVIDTETNDAISSNSKNQTGKTALCITYDHCAENDFAIHHIAAQSNYLRFNNNFMRSNVFVLKSKTSQNVQQTELQ